MKKIDKLTPEQEAKMPEYVEKWIKIGTNTDRLDPTRTKKTIDNYRKLINKTIDVPLLIVKNPIEAWVVCCLNEEKVPFENLITEMEKVFNGNPEKRNIPKASLPWQSGSFFAPTFSFYDFMIEELGVELEQELYAKYKIWEATAQIGCIYPLDNITVVCEKPTVIHLNENNVLHKDEAPALEYDGLGDFKVYALNGVRVPEYVALTPAEQLDLEYYNKITNADVRAEFVRKIGIERFLDKGTLMDTYENYDAETHEWWHKSQYELWDMSFLFDGLDYAPFIKMTNMTTGIFHVEGVSPECRTVSAALKERFGGRDFVISSIA